ncbi:ABC transporter permease/M1 family aminopeptidase [Algoriphagus formosus]|uniref:Peptidase M1 membrane alanine aminopeptidase domain-containing protein n=1 Tax=Algoriphagus formosus TaxID=2007308 RepID=A0A4R5V7Q4_9BACT|nr:MULTISPECIES: M1 family aminopeptidase [Algoriphagus]TDK47974.1 hypothetical protein E1898_04680 [Algoriphagus aquimaris]
MKQFFHLMRFELLIQLKSWTAPLFATVYFGFAFMMGGQGSPSSEAIYNSEFELFFKMGLLSLGAVFSIMFFAVKATQRDAHSHMEALIYATPISKMKFFLSRFFGAWLVSLIVILPAIIGFQLGLYFSDLDPSRIAEFQPYPSLSVAFKLLIPTITTLTTLLFIIGLLTKNQLATYAMAVGIYAAYFICSIFLNSPLMANAAPIASENLAWAALADPFGLSAFFHQTNLWTNFDKNQLGIEFSGLFAWNRIIWLIFSAALLTTAYRRFSFRNSKERPKEKKREKLADSVAFSQKKIIPQTGSYKSVFSSQLRLSIHFILKSIPFWTILGAWLIIAGTEIYFRLFAGGSYEESYLPASQILLDRVQQPLLLFGIILLLFISGSLVWREKDSQIHELVNATPAPKGHIFLSLAVTQILVIFTMISLTILVCLAFQLIENPWNEHSWAIFSLFLSPGFNLIFFSISFLLIQRISLHKYLGMGLSAISFGVFAGPLSSTVGLSHPLFLIGSTPFLTYSELAGFDSHAGSFLILSMLWGILAIALSFWLYSMWDKSISSRLQTMLRIPSVRWATVISILFLGLWTGIYLKTEKEGSFPSKSQVMDQRALYEKEFKVFEDAPVLAYADLDLEVEMFPSKGNYKAKVKGKLFNPFDKPITELLIHEKEKLNDFQLEKVADYGYQEDLGLFHITFSEEILPGDSLNFSLEVKPEKSILGTRKAIVQNGSYLNFRDFAPFFGYSESMEITDFSERKKRGLAPKLSEELDNSHSGITEKNLFKVPFEAIIKTEKTQTAITSGKLINEKIEGDQRVFHFKSTKAILPTVAFFSGIYQKDSIQSEGVQLEVYSLKNHKNIHAKTLQVMQEALEYFNQNFGEYPFDHLKLVEIPGFWGFGGYAHPGVISMTEDKYYLVKEGSPQFDLQTKRAVHEVAHQWFGHLLAPRNIPGATLLVEGLAKYAEVLLLEKMLGKSATWYLSDQANRTYFTGRAMASKPESSISKQDNQSYLAYGKSLSAFLAARELLGEEELNSIIRELVDKSLSEPKPVVDAELLIEKMKNQSSSEDQKLIEDWFEKVITYDIKIQNSQIEKFEEGLYQVTLDYEATKKERQSDGSELEISMDEEIEFAAFLTHPKGLQNDQEILLSQKVRVKSGKGQLKIRLDQFPEIISLDPWGTRTEQNREDNFFNIIGEKENN